MGRRRVALCGSGSWPVRLSEPDARERRQERRLRLPSLHSRDRDGLAGHHQGVLSARQGDWGSLRYQVMDLEPVVRRSSNSDGMSRIDHLKAELALARGDAREANELLENASGSKNALYEEAQARAYYEHGDLAQAEATFRSILDATDERLEFPLLYVKALLGMAKLLDAQEQGEEAASFYRRFLEHWETAVGPLPGVVEARSRLQQLEAQS